jgi:hypothetical protein
VPALNGVFSTVPSTAGQPAVAAGAAVVILGIVEAQKWWRRRA